MKVYTKSGSMYEIDDSGIMTKYDSEGHKVDQYRIYRMKAVPTDIKNMDEIWDLPPSHPEIGKLFYVGGKDAWWLSTPVVRIEY